MVIVETNSKKPCEHNENDLLKEFDLSFTKLFKLLMLKIIIKKKDEIIKRCLKNI